MRWLVAAWQLNQQLNRFFRPTAGGLAKYSTTETKFFSVIVWRLFIRLPSISAASCFDIVMIVAVLGNNVEATFDFVAFDNVASTLLLVWTGFYRRHKTTATITSLPPTLCVDGPVTRWNYRDHIRTADMQSEDEAEQDEERRHRVAAWSWCHHVGLVCFDLVDDLHTCCIISGICYSCCCCCCCGYRWSWKWWRLRCSTYDECRFTYFSAVVQLRYDLYLNNWEDFSAYLKISMG